MMLAALVLGVLGVVVGAALGFARRRFSEDEEGLVAAIDALLPQTQCAQCGYPGCRPYARASVTGDAPLNLCPPGGDDTIRNLAALLGRETVPLATGAAAAAVRAVAVIDESRCIGCAHCRTACPVDAIVGAHQFMHTVISTECTGCELCVEPCPVDCIRMETVQ